MKSFYLLNNGKFQEATLNQFRAGLQIGMFVDVYDTESSFDDDSDAESCYNDKIAIKKLAKKQGQKDKSEIIQF